MGVGGNGGKHVKGTINHQLQKFTPLPMAFLVCKKKFICHKFNFTDVVLIKWHMITYSMSCKGTCNRKVAVNETF